MTEQVVVDFSRVQAALDITQRRYEVATDRARVAVEQERARIATAKIAYIAAACALVIVSIGAAAWLARQRQVLHVERPSPATQFPTVTTRANVEQPNKVRTNITLFNSISREDLRLSNPYFFRLTAGHEYSTSNADSWNSAWCYADFRKDGLEYTVTLANRVLEQLVLRPPSQNELRELGLSQADASFLAARCPWRAR